MHNKAESVEDLGREELARLVIDFLHRTIPDYPCKSAGLVEYRAFAETIDSRIRTGCIACPPDAHPEEWFCAWRFTLA
jgi:hypothetical protein